MRLGASQWCTHPWPSWYSRPQGGSCVLAQNITNEQIPLVMKEYLIDAAAKHDWKTVRNHLLDLIGDATFVYSTLQAARYHRGMRPLRVTTPLPFAVQLSCFQRESPALPLPASYFGLLQNSKRPQRRQQARERAVPEE